MKFKYRHLRDTSGPGVRYIKLPLLAVRLDYRGKQTPIVGLVDTGATDCLFDRDVADDLGITLSSADPIREYVGVGGESVTGHMHRIKLQIDGFSEWVEFDAAFIDAKLPYQLLGESGFFDNYEVTLKRFRGRFQIKSRSFLYRS